MRNTIRNLLTNAASVLALAIIMGLAFGGEATFTKPAVTPLLGFAMTLSLLGVSSSVFADFKKLSRPILLSLALNYIALGGSFLGLAALLVNDYEIWTGFVLLAAVPPAVAVIPFAYRLNGNASFALVGTVATYLAALVITPLVYLLVFGTSLIEPSRLLVVLVELIIAPLLISRILLRLKIVSFLQRHRGIFVNWSFFFVTYTITGLNRELIWSQPSILLVVAFIAIANTYFLGFMINRISGRLGLNKPDRVSLILLGTTKNYALAAAIALEFFSSRASLPMAVSTIIFISYFIWLTLRMKKIN